MSAMSASKLLPEMFSWKFGPSQSPYMSLICGSCLGYLLCLLMYFVPFVSLHLYDICILSAFVAYSSQCVGYMFMQTRYENIHRDFRSPLGRGGAVFSLLVWLLCILSVAAFAEDNQFALIAFVCVGGVLTVYYFIYAKSRQTFSEEEKKVLFVAHVINCESTSLFCCIVVY